MSSYNNDSIYNLYDPICKILGGEEVYMKINLIESIKNWICKKFTPYGKCAEEFKFARKSLGKSVHIINIHNLFYPLPHIIIKLNSWKCQLIFFLQHVHVNLFLFLFFFRGVRKYSCDNYYFNFFNQLQFPFHKIFTLLKIHLCFSA